MAIAPLLESSDSKRRLSRLIRHLEKEQKNKGQTIAALARYMGVTQTAFVLWRDEKVSTMSVENLNALAAVSDRSLIEIIEYLTNPAVSLSDYLMGGRKRNLTLRDILTEVKKLPPSEAIEVAKMALEVMSGGKEVAPDKITLSALIEEKLQIENLTLSEFSSRVGLSESTLKMILQENRIPGDAMPKLIQLYKHLTNPHTDQSFASWQELAKTCGIESEFIDSAKERIEMI